MPLTRTMADRLRLAHFLYFEVVKAAAATTITLIFVVTVLGVFYRYFLNFPLVWSEELCRALLVWLCFLFAGAAFQRGEMIAVQILTDRLPRRLRALIVVPAYLMVVGFLGLLIDEGWRYARQNMIQTMPGIDAAWLALTGDESGVSIFWLYVSLPIGCALLAVHIAIAALRLALTGLDVGSAAGGEQRS
jgi:TRAP-type C4-dicarboxylate transport system permease small subunit